MATQNQQQDLSLLIGAGADPQALCAFLDGLDTAGRVREVRALSRKALGELYDRCASAPAVTLDEFCPPAAVGQTVIYAGINNLPLFRLFEKRFTRTASGTVVGYNHQTMMGVTGPGYFSVVPGAPPMERELLIDYTKVPAASEVPKDWPAVQPNDRGLSTLVYKNLHDYLRRVSRDVYIGHATRLGKPMPQYFVLART